MKTSIAVTVVIGILSSAFWLSGCGSTKTSAPTKADTPAGPAASLLPAGLFVKEMPAGAKSVIEAKKDVKEGDDIVIRGRIGGRAKGTFTDGRAMFILADAGIPSCNEKPGDKCETPWDFCCETPEDLVAKTATIQVVDANGKPLKQDLKGVGGLDHLSTIVVKGKVGKRDDPKILTVNATAIYIEKPSPLAVK